MGGNWQIATIIETYHSFKISGIKASLWQRCNETCIVLVSPENIWGTKFQERGVCGSDIHANSLKGQQFINEYDVLLMSDVDLSIHVVLMATWIECIVQIP